jgi:hypothetical protein
MYAGRAGKYVVNIRLPPPLLEKAARMSVIYYGLCRCACVFSALAARADSGLCRLGAGASLPSAPFRKSGNTEIIETNRKRAGPEGSSSSSCLVTTQWPTMVTW